MHNDRVWHSIYHRVFYLYQTNYIVSFFTVIIFSTSVRHLVDGELLASKGGAQAQTFCSLLCLPTVPACWGTGTQGLTGQSRNIHARLSA